ncbi:alpha-ketoacid dehydrogenase subunit alpha/beta [Jiulongibacter sediminis]|uniref:Transketolase n=1 Tax=Jiulongibacter sediminis TaxID=1605367 RepID=A0A0P7BYG7_9BACT|nr:alpha-ketoacid dehydrogenase subunit alpha/beta [Jiulongibacter sediminis]KPM46603.1 transketolase [Jiulongibacter sediminis]TBX21461.1 transketolase [Jiulongibacter sediminis]
MSEYATKPSLSSGFIVDTKEILADYRLAVESREVSLLGRKDVFMGRAKFGIFGDGKEVAQIAMSKVFRKGDFRSGYYRDQTLVAALGGLTWTQLFSQLYAHADLKYDIFSGGRSMNAHYGNAWVDEKGNWLNQTQLYNHVMDVSSTAGQIPRSVGLGFASKLYRNNPELKGSDNFSKNGNEICFSTIGDASTSQGKFFEAINAAGVLQIPVIFSVWDDGYGISVPTEYQTTKGSISEALSGFQRDEEKEGFEIIKVKGWDYVALIEAYQKAARLSRDQHIPCLIHVYELTQPQGHSASGSHERYKSKERLEWENEMDCNLKFREWILEEKIAEENQLEEIEQEAKETAKSARHEAWEAYKSFVNKDIDEVVKLLDEAAGFSKKKAVIKNLKKELKGKSAIRKDATSAAKQLLRILSKDKNPVSPKVRVFLQKIEKQTQIEYHSHLYSEFDNSPLKVKEVKPVYSKEPEVLSGYQIINKYFDQLFERDKRVFALGEDVGNIGDVNQGFAGLQVKFGSLRIDDTGIREDTIIGQGIGAAMRGLKPIVEVQYFDYIYYCLSVLTDDLASLRYRTFGQQQAPVIVRTRGHRLEGIWHSGSPLAVMINSLRGMHILCPRNFVQASGLYNTILKGEDPALMIEPLNSYRLKEKLPENLGDICVPLGRPDILKEGKDVTIVTYGSMCNIVLSAAQELAKYGIQAEVIDVQTLLPFDLHGVILDSLKKTNRIIFADEDMPGGTSAYMMQQIIEHQNGYMYLDSKPLTISAKEHRPPYGSDGDYFTKPNVDDIFDAGYSIMRESKPSDFPEL